MKNSTFKTILAVFLLGLCISCSNDDGGGDVLNNDTFLTAKVDGVDFEVRGSLFAVDSNIGGVKSTIMGANLDDDSKSISMGITNLTTGTHVLIDAENDDPLTSSYVSSLIYGEGKTGWYAIHQLSGAAGIITITELNDSYVVGTFSFTGVDIDSQTEKNISTGRFKIKRLNVK